MPKQSRVNMKPIDIATIRVVALTILDIPVSTCPSKTSIIELMSGTPGIKNNTLVAIAVSGVVPHPFK